ncbi:tail fiber assembly protein [Morganella morganii]
MSDINYYFDETNPLHPFYGDAYANKNSFAPANALRIKPEFIAGFHPCEHMGKWVQIPDYRGITVYETDTARELEVKELGELPEGVTTIAPDVDFPKWNGKKWVTDKVAKKESDIAAAEAQKQYLIAEVQTETQILQTKLTLGRIKDDEKAQLIAWLDYLDELEAVDVSTAPDIIWPVKPVV